MIVLNYAQLHIACTLYVELRQFVPNNRVLFEPKFATFELHKPRVSTRYFDLSIILPLVAYYHLLASFRR